MMNTRTALCGLGGLVILGVLLAATREEKPRCVGVAVVAGESNSVVVYRAFEDGTVEFEGVNASGTTSFPSGPPSLPAWLRRAK